MLALRRVIGFLGLMKPLLLCVVLFAFGAYAEDVDMLMESLRSELREAGKESVKVPQGAKGAKGTKERPTEEQFQQAQQIQMRKSQSANFLQMLRDLPPGDEWKEQQSAATLHAISQIRTASFSTKIDEICESLTRELRDRNARWLADFKERYNTTLGRVLSAGINAATGKELDEPLRDLKRLGKEVMDATDTRNHGLLPVKLDAISPLEQLLTAIQDALLATASPTEKRGKDAMDRLQSAMRDYGRQLEDLIPRSELVQKLQVLTDRVAAAMPPVPIPPKPMTREAIESKVDAILRDVKKLEDMGVALQKIDDLAAQQRDLRGSYMESFPISQLRSYRKTYEDLRSGAPTSLSFATTTYAVPNAESVTLNQLKVLLVKFALTRVLGAPADMGPKEEESAAAYLKRMLDLSLHNSDWQLVSRVIDTTQTMGLTSVLGTNDASALRQILAGVNQERARQFSFAVTSYLAALKTGSQAIPVEKIGDMLEKIKKDHPQDYEAGVQAAKAGLSANEERMRTIMDPRTSRFGSPGSNPAASTLVIPAAGSEAASGAK